MTGAQLKATHGERQFIFLTDNQPLELLYDLNAVMRHEKLFEVPLAGLVDPIRQRCTDEVMRTVPRDENGQQLESQQVVAQRIAAAVARELVRQKIASGHIQDLAEWAYCLTETYREDNQLELSWSQFKRLLPVPPPTGAATAKAKRKLEQATAWMMAVALVRAREEIDDEGNEEADVAGPGAPSAAPSASTGTPSTTSAPSNTAEPITNSGA